MSIVRCDGSGCANQIDTHQDVECAVEVGNMRRMTWTVNLCPGCRAKLLERQEMEAQQSSHGQQMAEDAEAEAAGAGGMK